MIKEINLNYLLDVKQIIDEQFGNDGWTKNQLIDSFNNKSVKIFGAFNCDQIVGFIIVLITLDDINILELAVKECYKRHGYAKRLIAYVRSLLKDNQTISLEVKSKNFPAINLYESMGFKTLRVRKKYYKDGDDAFCMFFSLTNIS